MPGPRRESARPAALSAGHRRLPGGGLVVVGPLSRGFDVTCGLFTGRFSVPQPPQPYTSPPLQGARVALELPTPHGGWLSADLFQSATS